MDSSNGLSWADQWDPDPDPLPTTSDINKKKGKDESKSKFGKALISFKWFKDFKKKSHKQSEDA